MKQLWVFVLLFAFWLVFSGHFDALHLGLGVLCSALVAFFSADLLFPDPPSRRTLVVLWRFAGYVPWLLYEIVLANFHVVYLVFRPQQIRPRVVRFRTRLTSDLARMTLGNSITLTPGTITMDIEDNEFVVHAVSAKAAESLRDGKMEERVARIFLESEPGGQPESGV